MATLTESDADSKKSALKRAAVTCERYISANGFSGAHVDKKGYIILPAGAVDAIQMPDNLGGLVREALNGLGLVTPIIVNSATNFLTFLTMPAPAKDTRRVGLFDPNDSENKYDEDRFSLRRDARLFKYRAIRTVSGATIMLPGPVDKVRSWLVPPDDHLRPDFNQVAQIAVEIGDRLKVN